MNSGVILKRAAAGLGLMVFSLFLAYNTYKEAMRAFDPLPMELRRALKGSFPEALLLFSACFLLSRELFAKKERGAGTLIPVASYALVLNIFFFTEGGHYILLHNLALGYFIMFSYLAASFRKFAVNAGMGEGVAGPLFNSPFVLKRLKAVSIDLPGFFFSAFTVSIAICGILVILQAGQAAKDLADISYFLLLAGLALELCGKGAKP